MPLTKLQIPSGIIRDSTSYAAGPRWYDCNNVRFRGGYAESIGGWARDETYTLQGIGRACFSSRDYSGNLYMFVGTNWKFYVIVSGVPYDITAVDAAVVDASGIFSRTQNSEFLKVSITGHGRSVDDWINFTNITGTVDTTITNSILTQVDGFQITEVEDLDNFYIRVIDQTTGLPVEASDVTQTGLGGTVTYRYRTQSGSNAQTTGNGWGTGDWGGLSPSRDWGDPSTSPVLTGEARRVYIDNYGEDIMFCNSGGPLYYWDVSAYTVNGIPGSGGTFDIGDFVREINDTNFSGASDPPTILDSFLISKRDGSCVGFGANDIGGTDQNSLLVRWSDQNNPFDWTPTPTNTAGGQVLRVGSRIVGGVSTKDEVVIFTDSAVYSMRFIGPPDVFSFSLISQNVEILSHKTAVDAASSVFFMGNDGFYVYGGGAVQPLECPVADYVYDDINMTQANKSFAAVDSKYSEIFWFYPSKSGASDGSFEVNRFVCFNYENQTWTIGSFDMSTLNNNSSLQSDVYNRTAWRDGVITDLPMASYIYEYNSNPANVGDRAGANVQTSAVMKHDFGTSAQGSTLDSYVESGDVELSDGNEMSFYSRIIPDLMMFNSSSNSSVTISINGKYYPGEDSSQEASVTANFDGPSGTEPSVITRYTVGSGSDANQYVQDMQVRGRARAAAVKVSASNASAQWRLGDVRIDTQPDGMR